MREIPPFQLELKPLSEDAEKLPPFEWAAPEIGSRHRLGGKPGFIQAEDRPVCPRCGQAMTFYAQLDSLNDEFCIADCGMIYVFFCFDCLETKSIIQSS